MLERKRIVEGRLGARQKLADAGMIAPVKGLGRREQTVVLFPVSRSRTL